jgi:hypothetical protein
MIINEGLEIPPKAGWKGCKLVIIKSEGDVLRLDWA